MAGWGKRPVRVGFLCGRMRVACSRRQNGGSPCGHPPYAGYAGYAGWAPLSPDYIKRPRQTKDGRKASGRGGAAHPILQASGQSGLVGSIAVDSDHDSASISVGKEYAAIHQFGGQPGMRPGTAAIPARPYLPVSADGQIPGSLRDDVPAIIAEHLLPAQTALREPRVGG
jgi:phage gpG-like protein